MIWVKSHVLFVTINLPGGSNNDTDIWYGAPSASASQLQEKAERTAADMRWLNLAFGAAKALRLKGVVIGAQADMWDAEKGVAHQTEYEPFVSTIAAQTTSFGEPVLLLNGDSHVYRSDNPLLSTDPLIYMHPVVHGSTVPLEYLRLTVYSGHQDAVAGAESFGPFSWERVIQP